VCYYDYYCYYWASLICLDFEEKYGSSRIKDGLTFDLPSRSLVNMTIFDLVTYLLNLHNSCA
jgi:hypothetical protein